MTTTRNPRALEEGSRHCDAPSLPPPSVTDPRWALTTLLVSGLLFAACDATPPIFLEVSEVSDTNVEDGPYEVRARVRDENGIGRVRLFWTVDGVTHADDMPLLVDDQKTPTTFQDGALVTRPRFRGEIPGQKLGTVVEWGIEACDTRDNCALTPPVFPLHPFTFVIGLEPSSPVIERVTPPEGPVTGGTRVIIDGSDLRPGVVVSFGENASTNVEWIRTDRLAVEAPAGTVGVVDVTVTNPDGASATLPLAYTYRPAPVLSTVSPSQGPTGGGTTVTLTGVGFVEGVSGFFDGVRCRNAARIDDTRLVCETPPGRRGPVDVDVRDDEGSRSVLEGAFTYVPPPVIDGVVADRGPDLGGTLVEIRGADFDDDALVLVGGVPCEELLVVNASLLLCTTPAHTAGIVDVEVVNSDGQSAVLEGAFNFLGPPLVVLVVPDEGPRAGGQSARIIGAGFSDTMAVRFGGVVAEIVDIIDDIEIEVVVPASTLPLVPAPLSGIARVDVTATNLDPSDGRSHTKDDGYGYFWPPVVIEVIPDNGPTSGGTNVTVIGQFFRNITGEDFVVLFGDVPCTNVVVVSSTTLTCTTPAGPEGFVDVTVSNHPDSSGTLVDGYLYIPPPEVIDVIPGDGPTFGGERVQIVGRFFQPGAIVFIDGQLCTNVTFISATALECTTPPHDAGFVDVEVVNPDGQSDTGELLYQYLPVAVVPNFGLEAGFTRVRVLAAGMQTGVTIRFGGVLGVQCNRVSDREVICQTPAAGTPGPVTVSFTNPDGSGDAAENGFTYKRFVDATAGRMNGLNLHANDAKVIDLDGDNDLDVVVANGVSGDGVLEDSHVHLNDGLGNFVRSTLPGGSRIANSVDFGELNDDGRPDIVLGTSEDGGAFLFRNDGNGVFATVATPSAGFGIVRGAFDAQLVNLVGDAKDDLLILSIGCSNNFQNPELCDDLATGADGLFERTGAPVWVDRSTFIPNNLGYVHDHKIAATDLDGDGRNDIVLFVDNDAFGAFGNEHRVLYNRTNVGQGFVEDKTPFVGLVGDVFGVDTGDIDGDGDPDVIGGGCHPPFESSELVYLNQNGSLVRSFSSLPNEVDDCNFGVHLFDVDIDGDLDLGFSGERGGLFIMKMYVNKGDGTFVLSPLSVPAFSGDILDTQGTGMTSGDFDDDDDPDVVLTSTGFGFGALRLLLLQ